MTPENFIETLKRKTLSVDEYTQGVLQGSRSTLGRAITLVESQNSEHQLLAQEMLTRLLPHTGRSLRVGITGVPGVGKSTFIESLGSFLTSKGHKVAVLAIDPSSGVSGGSILGDKTRMQNLSVDPLAFVRPSPSSGSLGGVTRKTRESMLVCEAAGYDVIIVETVGVGQSETVVAEMVDFFLVLMLAGAGDELQGIKRGILELADLIAVNKADGENLTRAKQASAEYESALRLMKSPSPGWKTPVVCCSALKSVGISELWQKVLDHEASQRRLGTFQKKRQKQLLNWMWTQAESQLMRSLRAHEKVKACIPEIEYAVLNGQLTATLGAKLLLEHYGHSASNWN